MPKKGRENLIAISMLDLHKCGVETNAYTQAEAEKWLKENYNARGVVAFVRKSFFLKTESVTIKKVTRVDEETGSDKDSGPSND